MRGLRGRGLLGLTHTGTATLVVLGAAVTFGVAVALFSICSAPGPEQVDERWTRLGVAEPEIVFCSGGEEGNPVSFQLLAEPAPSLTAPVLDDDAPALESTPENQETQPPELPLVRYADLVQSFYDRITANHQHGDGASGAWNKRFLKAMRHAEYVNYPQAAATVADAQRIYDHISPGGSTAWDGTVEALTYAYAYYANTDTTD